MVFVSLPRTLEQIYGIAIRTIICQLAINFAVDYKRLRYFTRVRDFDRIVNDSSEIRKCILISE